MEEPLIIAFVVVLPSFLLQVAQNAILALGLIGGGTNNSRIAGLLRQLAEFYSREASLLFIVRIAQGLLHAGKGLVTMNPFHSDRFLLSGVALSGILTILHAALDMKNTILDKHHYLIYSIVTALHPRFLITVDEEMKPLPVSVRVGQAVETVGQAGRPKTITGFQTHTTPVLLGVKDRAELATNEYLAYSNVLVSRHKCVFDAGPLQEGEGCSSATDSHVL